MFSEVVKLIPSMDRTAVNRMFNTLNQRFASVAKKFGQGMKNVMKFGGFAAVGGAILAKVLNPLEKAEEVIDRILNKGDDAATNAEEFGTSPGKLLRLDALGQMKGLDPDAMRMMLAKFQSSLAEESEKAKDPKNAPGTLRQFVGIKDTGDAFFQFIQTLSNLGRTDKNRQILVQNEVFGEKLRGKASELINATDLGDLVMLMPSVEELTKAAEKIAQLSDLRDRDAALRDLRDFLVKSTLMGKGQINAIGEGKQKELDKENNSLARFKDLKDAKNQMDELLQKFDDLATSLSKNVVPLLTTSLEGLNMLAGSPVTKSVTDFFTKPTPPGTPTVENLDKNADQAGVLVYTLQEIWKELRKGRSFFGGK